MSIREYQGKTVGVDAMCWMHRGAVASAESLVFGKQSRSSDRFIQFIMKMVQLLLDFQIRPLLGRELIWEIHQIESESFVTIIVVRPPMIHVRLIDSLLLATIPRPI